METKLICPQCGAEFAVPEHTYNALVQVLGKDANLGAIYLHQVGQSSPAPSRTSHNPEPTTHTTHNIPPTEASADGVTIKLSKRLEALKSAGIDVSRYMVMTDGDGKEQIATRHEDGSMTMGAQSDDPVVTAMLTKGKLYNAHLFKQWVLAGMFSHMTDWCFATYRDENGDEQLMYDKDGFAVHRKIGVHESIQKLGIDYSFRMLNDEFMRQAAMYRHGDQKNLRICNLFYNQTLGAAMIENYIAQLRTHISRLRTHTCHGRKYVYVRGAEWSAENGKTYKGTFIDDVESDIIHYFVRAKMKVNRAKTPIQLHHAWEELMKRYISLPWSYRLNKHGMYPRRKEKEGLSDRFRYLPYKFWVDAYKGYGAYWSMQNLIEFHGCLFHHECLYYGGSTARLMNRQESIKYLNDMLEQHYSEGFWLLGMLKQLMDDNNIDIEAKRKEWHRK